MARRRLTELEVGKIYFIHVVKSNCHYLCQLDRISHPTDSDNLADEILYWFHVVGSDTGKFADRNSSIRKSVLIDGKCTAKEVPLSDLPLYVGLPYTHELFTKLLKKAEHERAKSRRHLRHQSRVGEKALSLSGQEPRAEKD
jgi:hypothetical protein